MLQLSYKRNGPLYSYGLSCENPKRRACTACASFGVLPALGYGFGLSVCPGSGLGDSGGLGSGGLGDSGGLGCPGAGVLTARGGSPPGFCDVGSGVTPFCGLDGSSAGGATGDIGRGRGRNVADGRIVGAGRSAMVGIADGIADGVTVRVADGCGLGITVGVTAVAVIVAAAKVGAGLTSGACRRISLASSVSAPALARLAASSAWRAESGKPLV